MAVGVMAHDSRGRGRCLIIGLHNWSSRRLRVYVFVPGTTCHLSRWKRCLSIDSEVALMHP